MTLWRRRFLRAVAASPLASSALGGISVAAPRPTDIRLISEANASIGAPSGRAAANEPWAARFPGVFSVRDGYVRTSDIGGPGLGIPDDIVSLHER